MVLGGVGDLLTVVGHSVKFHVVAYGGLWAQFKAAVVGVVCVQAPVVCDCCVGVVYTGASVVLPGFTATQQYQSAASTYLCAAGRLQMMCISPRCIEFGQWSYVHA